MWRFLFLTVVLLVIGGTILHFEVSVPYVSLWLGKLPGDFILQNNDATVHFPITSAALISLIISSLLWMIFRKKDR